jgi:hypothetical protein
LTGHRKQNGQHHNNQLVKDVQGENRPLLWDSYKTQGPKYTVKIVRKKIRMLKQVVNILTLPLWFNPSRPNGYYMYHQFNIRKFYVLPTQCIYAFCVDLRTNSNYFPTKHGLVFITEIVFTARYELDLYSTLFTARYELGL